ncbi:MAG TPA: anti-sigma factor [Chitinophaga sp.]|uniref:anti-sigma factor n=1 Tax=Chitinophaga sp. TaxID=1869181 RepID=UPI002BCCCC06|nr:anti-sigma factor [Chitinophaga sp.]HVI49169.1 anti-sigma factor [Chitinophaga sp.]
MDVQHYISSGILESYVFGLLSSPEQEEIESIASQYPEVKAAVDALQEDKAKFVKLFAVVPPVAIKDRMLDVLRHENTPNGHQLLPAELRTVAPVVNGKARNGKHTPVVKLQSPKKKRDHIWKYLAAAIVVLLLGSVFMNFFFYNRSTDYKSRYKSLIAAREKLEAEKAQQSLTSQPLVEKEPAILKDPAYRQFRLEGSGRFSNYVATVCWNPQTHMLFLIAQLMPVPPEGKQFQLWAVLNKKLVDAGVFESGAALAGKLQQMKPIADVQAFAITLEKTGGSTSPSLDQLCMATRPTK